MTIVLANTASKPTFSIWKSGSHLSLLHPHQLSFPPQKYTHTEILNYPGLCSLKLSILYASRPSLSLLSFPMGPTWPLRLRKEVKAKDRKTNTQHTDKKLNIGDESSTEIQTFNEWVEKVQQRWLRKRAQRPRKKIWSVIWGPQKKWQFYKWRRNQLSKAA